MRELQPWVILGERVVPLGSLYQLLHGTQGPKEKTKKGPGEHQDEAPIGQKVEQDYHLQLGKRELTTSVRDSLPFVFIIYCSIY